MLWYQAFLTTGHLTESKSQRSEIFDFGIKQNPKYAISVDKKQNWIIFNRVSVIQNQHRRLVVGHPVLYFIVGYIHKYMFYDRFQCVISLMFGLI